MEKYLTLLEEAHKLLMNADHMAYTTYPLLNDPKLIIAIAENLYKSLIKTVEALLNFEYFYKRIDRVPLNQKEQLEIFERHLVKQYSFDKKIIESIEDLHQLVEFRKKSPMEFVRKDNFVICSSNYSSKILNFKRIKEYLQNTKKFMMRIDGVLG